jgi:alkanesulfonate monooxygenase SsuD/methylene tetrahydromethanopterin reductase-like flavin-dependent oxidoreductase (luciferase family)
MSCGRLTVGFGVGNRPDDFVADGYGMAGRGSRFDRDLETFHATWQGESVGGGPNPAVPAGTRQIPMLFGGFSPAAMNRMTRWGEGYIGASMPAPMIAPTFDAAREAWQQAGRDGSPWLVALLYYALREPDEGKRNVYDYYSVSGDEIASTVAGGVCDSAATIEAAISSFADIGADELIFNPGTDNPDEVARLAEIVF